MSEKGDLSREENLDLPVNPNAVLIENAKLIPTLETKPLSRKEIKKFGLQNPGIVSRYESVIATEDVSPNVAKAISVALKITPDKVSKRLGTPEYKNKIPIIVTGGSLRLKTGQRVPALIDIQDNNPITIRVSVENLRISFGLQHDQPSSLDPIICFAATVHEVCDWIQFSSQIHDSIFGLSDTDERARAEKHKASKSEQLSNELANELTEEFFGVTVTFGENEERIFTPEPKNT